MLQRRPRHQNSSSFNLCLTSVKQSSGWRNVRNMESAKGGILADEQGLGKTITGIAHSFHNSLDSVPCRTLIVCPTSLITQWEKQIRTHVKDEYNDKICKYCGSDRFRKIGNPSKYDFVLTNLEGPRISKNIGGPSCLRNS